MQTPARFVRAFAPFLLALLLVPALGCGPRLPFECSHRTDHEDRDQCVREMTALHMLFFNPARSSASSPPSGTTQSVHFTQESSNSSNDTFLAAYSLSMPGKNTIEAISGKINTEGDVDIYYVSYTSGSASTFTVDLSKPAATSTCSAYTSFGVSIVNSGTPDGSLISAGAISANVAPVTLDFVSRTHLYVRCCGALNETYTVRLAYSAVNP